MKTTRLCACLLLLFLFTFAAAEARADTLVVNGGAVVVRALGGSGEVSFSILGSNFSFAGGPAPWVMAPGCYPCAPGSVAPSNFSTGAINQVNFQIDGVGYNWRDYSIGNTLSITGPTYVVARSVTVPFTFTGFVRVTGSAGQELENHNLVGQGFVTIEHDFFDFGGGIQFYEFERATYNFSPAPVPEPATLLLLATGLAGAGGAALRRRKALRDAGR